MSDDLQEFYDALESELNLNEKEFEEWRRKPLAVDAYFDWVTLEKAIEKLLPQFPKVPRSDEEERDVDCIYHSPRELLLELVSKLKDANYALDLVLERGGAGVDLVEKYQEAWETLQQLEERAEEAATFKKADAKCKRILEDWTL